MLSERERKTLLDLARRTLKALLAGQPVPHADVESPALRAPGGAFVTLKNHGRLRGCIGTFESPRPLVETVQQMAAAATRDPRFLSNPVSADELDDIDIEISVLSPLEKTADPLKEIELGRHGISIEGPYGSGCFLPQVATEQGWDVNQMLTHLSLKAGLPEDAWKEGASFLVFQAVVFSENEK